MLALKATRVRGVAGWSFLVLLAVAFASCTLRLVSDYDEQLDRAATELQREMDAHLTRLAALGSQPAAGFAANEAFYLDYGVKLRSVRVRAQAHERNEITIQQLDRMSSSLEELRDQHERGGTLSPAFVTTARELFNTSWAAIIAWEIAKKRGA